MTVDHKFANTGASSVLELLQSKGQFIVPPFQRNYSWDVERASSLWSDLMDTFHIAKDQSESVPEIQYLLGSIVLVSNEPGKYYVIDGQQRLATLTILFCVGRDIIYENVKSEKNLKPDGIDKIMEMLENKSMGKHKGWKLVLNDADKDLFRQIQEYESDTTLQIDRIKQLDVKTKSEKLLVKNYIFLYNKMTESLYNNFDDAATNLRNLQSMSDDEKKRLINENIGMLNYFLTHVLENNFVVRTMVSDYSTAYQMFETLNERGQTL